MLYDHIVTIYQVFLKAVVFSEGANVQGYQDAFSKFQIPNSTQRPARDTIAVCLFCDRGRCTTRQADLLDRIDAIYVQVRRYFGCM